MGKSENHSQGSPAPPSPCPRCPTGIPGCPRASLPPLGTRSASPFWGWGSRVGTGAAWDAALLGGLRLPRTLAPRLLPFGARTGHPHKSTLGVGDPKHRATRPRHRQNETSPNKGGTGRAAAPPVTQKAGGTHSPAIAAPLPPPKALWPAKSVAAPRAARGTLCAIGTALRAASQLPFPQSFPCCSPVLMLFEDAGTHFPHPAGFLPPCKPGRSQTNPPAPHTPGSSSSLSWQAHNISERGFSLSKPTGHCHPHPNHPVTSSQPPDLFPARGWECLGSTPYIQRLTSDAVPGTGGDLALPAPCPTPSPRTLLSADLPGPRSGGLPPNNPPP